jgi:hypothetical protein
MKRTGKQRWRERVALNIPDGVVDLIGRKETPCVVRHARAAECKLDGRTINVRAYDGMDAFTRQVVLSSGPVSIASLVPTLP